MLNLQDVLSLLIINSEDSRLVRNSQECHPSTLPREREKEKEKTSSFDREGKKKKKKKPGYTMPRSFFPPQCPCSLTFSWDSLTHPEYITSMHKTLVPQREENPRTAIQASCIVREDFSFRFSLSFKIPNWSRLWEKCNPQDTTSSSSREQK